MHLDILIFAAIAVFLALRLKSVLGTRHGGEKPLPNPFTEVPPAVLPPSIPSSDPVAERVAGVTDDALRAGLEEIAAADPAFRLDDFLAGARFAFETIVTGYHAGRRAALEPLLSPALYAQFIHGIEAREAQGQTVEFHLRSLREVSVVSAHLGGVMAYVTMRFMIEQVYALRDRQDVVIEGDVKTPTVVENLWTFTRDVRNADPNWTLIETRVGAA